MPQSRKACGKPEREPTAGCLSEQKSKETLDEKAIQKMLQSFAEGLKTVIQGVNS